MSINTEHEQYVKYSPQWKKINDFIDIENVEDYLIYLNPQDKRESNVLRNKDYKERAFFYSLASDTLIGQIGLMFKKQPECELSPELEYLKTNADGRGNSIFQQSQRVCKSTTSIGRDGLYTSFPVTDGNISQADIDKGLAVATIQRISADRIINWREQSFGSKIKLTLVVFKDTEETFEDYELKKIETRRELYLEEGIYRERTWKQSDKDSNDWIASEPVTPADKNGSSFDEIQFDFIGSVNNDPDVDVPPYKGLVEANEAHYRNSAEYEDNVHWIGQSQAWMSGITQNHLNLMEKNKMYIGSRDLIGVPAGERFGIESAPENPAVRQAMIDKVDVMVSMGAKQVTVGGVAKTANQTEQEKGSQYSVLSLVANNVSDGYTSALARVERFMIGKVTGKSFYKINTDFIEHTGTPAELKEMMTGFLSATVPPLDYIRYMKKQKKFDESKSDEDYLEDLDRGDTPPNLGGE